MAAITQLGVWGYTAMPYGDFSGRVGVCECLPDWIDVALITTISFLDKSTTNNVAMEDVDPCACA